MHHEQLEICHCTPRACPLLQERHAQKGLEICNRSLQGQCMLGDKCHFSHDMAAYLKQKPADLPGRCPFSSDPAPCPFGASCIDMVSYPGCLVSTAPRAAGQGLQTSWECGCRRRVGSLLRISWHRSAALASAASCMPCMPGHDMQAEHPAQHCSVSCLRHYPASLFQQPGMPALQASHVVGRPPTVAQTASLARRTHQALLLVCLQRLLVPALSRWQQQLLLTWL